MLSNYINRAMELALYEIVEDDGTYWGEIPPLQGVWANHPTLEGCRIQLKEALGDWIALRLRLGLNIPVINNFTFSIIKEKIRATNLSREENKSYSLPAQKPGFSYYFRD